MASVNRRTWLAMCGVAPVAGALAARASNHSRFQPALDWRETIQVRYLPNVRLLTHEGRPVRFYDDLIKNKVVLINFTYANCEGICPGITANLVKVQQRLGDRVGRDLFMYSITLKPAHDTPAVLRDYADMHGIGPGWLFLTGEPDDIELLRRKLGFTDPDPIVDRDTSNHVGVIRYGNERLQLWAACPGMADPDWIVRSVSWVERPRAAHL